MIDYSLEIRRTISEAKRKTDENLRKAGVLRESVRTLTSKVSTYKRDLDEATARQTAANKLVEKYTADHRTEAELLKGKQEELQKVETELRSGTEGMRKLELDLKQMNDKNQQEQRSSANLNSAPSGLSRRA